jgi:hypothetical protein
MDFPIYTIDTAPEASKAALAQAKATFGFIPNLEGIFAQAPSLSKAQWRCGIYLKRLASPRSSSR